MNIYFLQVGRSPFTCSPVYYGNIYIFKYVGIIVTLVMSLPGFSCITSVLLFTSMTSEWSPPCLPLQAKLGSSVTRCKHTGHAPQQSRFNLIVSLFHKGQSWSQGQIITVLKDSSSGSFLRVLKQHLAHLMTLSVGK